MGNKTEKQLPKCSTCRGTGQVAGFITDKLGLMQKRMVTCTSCAGTGYA